MTPLTELREGQGGMITEVRGGRVVVQRLAAVGIRPGVEVSVQRNRGPLIVRVRSDRLILGKGVAVKVMVRRPHAAVTPAPRRTP